MWLIGTVQKIQYIWHFDPPTQSTYTVYLQGTCTVLHAMITTIWQLDMN